MSVCYNDHDPAVAAWLRALVAAGHLPAGPVDDRDLEALTPADLKGFDHVHLFAGIGGWPLAVALAGWPPDRPVWSASFPCQPFSAAGARRGTDDARHLWPAGRDLVAQCRPATIVGEQVASSDGREWLARVFADLEALGYRCAGADLCAAGVAAPHRRQRLFWIADRLPDADGVAGGQGGTHGRGRGAGGEAQCRPGSGGGGRDRGGLGDTDGGRRPPRDGAAAPDRHRRAAVADGGTCRLPDAGCVGLQSEFRSGGPHGAAGAPEGSARQRQRGGPAAGDCGPPSRLPDAGGARLEGHAGHGDDGNQPGRLDALAPRHAAAGGDAAAAGWWGGAVLVTCDDDKVRRLEPGLVPLADGIPARMVRLRGYGNAIVPPLAARFLTCALAALDDNGG